MRVWRWNSLELMDLLRLFQVSAQYFVPALQGNPSLRPKVDNLLSKTRAAESHLNKKQ